MSAIIKENVIFVFTESWQTNVKKDPDKMTAMAKQSLAAPNFDPKAYTTHGEQLRNSQRCAGLPSR